MTPANVKRLHKYMLDIEYIEHATGSPSTSGAFFHSASPHKSGKARIACASIVSHCQLLIASIIVTAHAAPKITTNTRSPCAAARPQPSAASAESMTSSRTRGSIYRILFISHFFSRRPDPPASHAIDRSSANDAGIAEIRL